MKSFKSFAEIEKYLQKTINDALNKELSQHVKEEIQTAVSTEVYMAGIPKVYVRRGGNDHGGMGNPLGTGSLADTDTMNHTVNNGELVVTNNALPSDPTFGDLTENIVMGYGSRDAWYNKPRDFIGEAKKNMEETGSHIEVMKDALRSRGLNVLD